MYRKDLIDLLLERPMSVVELARLFDQSPRAVDEDLRHLFKSLKATRYRAVVDAAVCRKCGFVFERDKLRKPGKCPRCRGTWINEPHVAIVADE